MKTEQVYGSVGPLPVQFGAPATMFAYVTAAPPETGDVSCVPITIDFVLGEMKRAPCGRRWRRGTWMTIRTPMRRAAASCSAGRGSVAPEGAIEPVPLHAVSVSRKNTESAALVTRCIKRSYSEQYCSASAASSMFDVRQPATDRH